MSAEKLSTYFQTIMQKWATKMSVDDSAGVELDMRSEGVDFYATMLSDARKATFCCKGIYYKERAPDQYISVNSQNVETPIDESEYREHLDRSLECIGARSETGVSLLVKRHKKPFKG